MEVPSTACLPACLLQTQGTARVLGSDQCGHGGGIRRAASECQRVRSLAVLTPTAVVPLPSPDCTLHAALLCAEDREAENQPRNILEELGWHKAVEVERWRCGVVVERWMWYWQAGFVAGRGVSESWRRLAASLAEPLPTDPALPLTPLYCAVPAATAAGKRCRSAPWRWPPRPAPHPATSSAQSGRQRSAAAGRASSQRCVRGGWGKGVGYGIWAAMRGGGSCNGEAVRW